jgi:NAD+ diphosphatase
MSAFEPNRTDAPAPAFTGATLDRAATLRRDPQWVASLLDEPTAVAVAASDGGVLLARPAGSEPALMRHAIADDGAPPLDPARAILLGIEDGAALFALDLEGLDPAARSRLERGAEIVSLRDAGTALSHAEAGLAAYATALLNWHRRHRFCANCGAETELIEAGFSRRCPRCGATHFPRTDPVVIMLVEHAGRLLLGRRHDWPEHRYSLLAGFVSPGETLEQAVVREVREESGIEAHDPRYVASQPWPFPSSLMLGFAARSDGGEPTARDGELEDVGWFTLEHLRDAQGDDGGELRLPPPVSIARFLIDRWVAQSAV